MIMSYYPRVNDIGSTEVIELADLHREITDGSLKETIEELRDLRAIEMESETKAGYKEHRAKYLPAVTPAGVFRPERRTQYWVEPSGLMVLDFDDIADPNLMRMQLGFDKHVALAFVSPSGKGVKIFVRVRKYSNPQEFKRLFVAVKGRYEQLYNLRADNGGDCARSCFLSYDPNAYINEDAEELDLALPSSPIPGREPGRAPDLDPGVTKTQLWNGWQAAVGHWQMKCGRAKEGSRHETVLNAAIQLYRAVPHQVVEEVWENAVKTLENSVSRPFRYYETQEIIDWARESDIGQEKRWYLYFTNSRKVWR